MTKIDEFPYLISRSYRYHVLTKHSLESLYSPSASLDWAQQPDPFRIYVGSKKVALPGQFYGNEIDLFQLIREMLAGHGVRETDNAVPPRPAPGDIKLISSLLYYSMAISAWKQIKGTDHKWALRVNPSSGNLHPTETHMLVAGIDGIEDGAYHYSVKDHALEMRSADDILTKLWNLLAKPQADAPPIMLVLNSIFWRESWKYKDRSFRYCQLDLGHAAAAICLAAAGFGWSSQVIAEFPDLELAGHLGLADSDEKPMLLIPLYPDTRFERFADFDLLNAKTVDATDFLGSPNRLSSSEVHYQSIQYVYRSGRLSKDEYLARTKSNEIFPCADPFAEIHGERRSLSAFTSFPVKKINALTVIRKRRSAVDMDGRLRISLAHMARILIDSTRGFASSYLTVLPFTPAPGIASCFIDILLYVHRVDGLAPGVYYFDRRSLELTLLNEGNVHSQAKFVSCLQDIASDGVFAVSLVANLRAAFQCFGERAYRYIHQEAGFIGHLFYLTARALDIDATGIGCFLDDEINQHLPPGIETVYNFTFGKAVQDPRLTDLPAYDFQCFI